MNTMLQTTSARKYKFVMLMTAALGSAFALGAVYGQSKLAIHLLKFMESFEKERDDLLKEVSPNYDEDDYFRS